MPGQTSSVSKAKCPKILSYSKMLAGRFPNMTEEVRYPTLTDFMKAVGVSQLAYLVTFENPTRYLSMSFSSFENLSPSALLSLILKGQSGFQYYLDRTGVCGGDTCTSQRKPESCTGMHS